MDRRDVYRQRWDDAKDMRGTQRFQGGRNNVHRRYQGVRRHMGSDRVDRGGSSERQYAGGWVNRLGPGPDRSGGGGGGGGFLRKRMGESSVRGPGGSRTPPVTGAGELKHPNKKLTDLTFEEYLQVCGEIEEAYRRVLWQHRMSQPNARSEWRALCIQNKVPYQQSFQ